MICSHGTQDNSFDLLDPFGSDITKLYRMQVRPLIQIGPICPKTGILRSTLWQSDPTR
jgi:hypothetical protein